MTNSIEFVAQTGSTNADVIERIARDGQIAEGAWLVADRQTTGRGRQGRSWLDAAGNFMGSTAVKIASHDPPAATLSFVAALAVYEAVLPRLANPASLQIKWPNDVMLDGAKFCGILLEREGDYAVIGIGVNLASAPKLPDREVKALADSGPVPERDAFARDLAGQLAAEVQRWREFGFESIRRRWQAAAHPVGTKLSVHDGDGGRLAGTFAGLEDDGALCLRLADGAVRVIRAGDVMLEAR